MSKQIALLSAIAVLTDGFKDIEAALKPGQSVFQRVQDFQNLIPDAIAEAQSGGIDELKAEIAALQPSDYVSLAGVLVADLSIADAHANAIVQAALKVMGDVAPDVMPLIAAIANKPAPAPVAPAPADPVVPPSA